MKKVVLGVSVIALSLCLTGCAHDVYRSALLQEDSHQVDKPEQAKKQDIPTGEFSVADITEEPKSEYYPDWVNVVIKLRNNTDENKTLLGCDVTELDADGNIIDFYESYNKNAVEIPVDPGQSASIKLLSQKSDGIAGAKVTKYFYENPEDPGIKHVGQLTEPFTKMF